MSNKTVKKVIKPQTKNTVSNKTSCSEKDKVNLEPDSSFSFAEQKLTTSSFESHSNVVKPVGLLWKQANKIATLTKELSEINEKNEQLLFSIFGPGPDVSLENSISKEQTKDNSANGTLNNAIELLQKQIRRSKNISVLLSDIA